MMVPPRHCERSEAIQSDNKRLDCFVALAPRNDVSILIQLLDCHGDALADADAHGGERTLSTALLHAVYGGHDQPCAAHAKRMAERNRAAMRIDEVGVFGNAELAQAGDALAGKGFVELDQIEIRDLQSEPFHQFPC